MEVTIKFFSQVINKESFGGEEPDDPFFGITFKSKKEGRRILPLAEVGELSAVELAKAIKADCGLSGDMTTWVCAIINNAVEQENKGVSNAHMTGGILKLQAVKYSDYQKEVGQ